jgi:hypothetical protein
MDYRYLLYFERGARFDALEHLARMAAPTDDGPTTIVLPDRSLELPFGTWGKPRQQISGDDTGDAWNFSTVLCFPPDQALDNYLHYFDREGSDNRRYDDLGRLEIGYIDLSVHDVKGTDLVCFMFGTTGSSMSILFMESESIRSSLLDLLASCRGVYAVFDMEDFADLIWLRGEERDDRLPTADLSLAQIEELLSPAPAAPPAGPSAPLPLSFAAEQVFAGVRHVRRTTGGSELGVHHWLVALHEHDGDPRASTSRQALASGDIGDPLPEDRVRERAIARARQDGRSLVSLEDVASAIAEAAG